MSERTSRHNYTLIVINASLASYRVAELRLVAREGVAGAVAFLPFE